jgi:hypothetical protein
MNERSISDYGHSECGPVSLFNAFCQTFTRHRNSRELTSIYRASALYCNIIDKHQALIRDELEIQKWIFEC